MSKESTIIHQAANALRRHERAVPGFCPSLPELLECLASQPTSEAGQLAFRVAQSIRRPARRRPANNRTDNERNDDA